MSINKNNKSQNKQMNILDKQVLENIIATNFSIGPCKDGTCLHCQIQEDLLNISCLDEVYTNLLLAQLHGNMYVFHDAIAIGFSLAYDYCESRKLEELIK